VLPLLLDVRDLHLQQHTGTGGAEQPRRGARGESHPAATLAVWAGASRVDKDAAPSLNTMREMAQLVPPPCPHRGCATPRPQNPHPCEEHPWGTTASCSRMKAAKGLLGVAMQSLPGTGMACQRIWEKKAVVWLCSPIPVAAAVRQSSCCFCWGKQNWKHAPDILQDVKV